MSASSVITDSGPADTRRSAYVRTDLVSLLTQAQQAMHKFIEAHPEEMQRVSAAAPWCGPGEIALVAGEAKATAGAAIASCSPPQRRQREESGNSADGGHRSRGQEDLLHPPIGPADLDTANNALWASIYADIVKIQAPMVRCSRPAFRKLCRAWGTDISYTHMIIAESFAKSERARQAEFAMYAGEDRLVVQMAAKNGPTAAAAATLLAPYCDAIDINCGCPQRWAIREGIGSALLEKPEDVADMVRCINNAVTIPCVVKMRVYDDMRKSVDFARQCEAAGAGWLTVHGRTPTDGATAAVRWQSIAAIQEAVRIPVVANGGVDSPSSAVATAMGSRVGAVMAGNSLLDNPAMFHLPRTASEMNETLTFEAGRAAVLQHKAASSADMCNLFRNVAPNESALRPLWSLPATPVEVISDYMRASMQTNLMYATTVQQVLRMARVYLTPTERSFLALVRSNAGVWSSLDRIGLYTEKGNIQYE